MPIEIRELHIKVSVTTPEPGQSSQNTAASGSPGRNNTDRKQKDEIVAECVEKVMEILKNKIER